MSIVVLLVAANASAAARNVVIGFATDGATQWETLPVAAIEREIVALLGDEFTLSLPPAKQLAGDWTLGGARRALDTLLADRSVDIVIATGILTSQAAAQIDAPRKPLIAALVIDATLQQFPLKDGASGRNNFTYIASFRGIEEELASFRDVTGFKHLAVVADRAVIAALPELASRSHELAGNLGFTASIVPAEASVDALLAALPDTADAVYVAPLRRMSPQNITRLASAFTRAGLPSFSAFGRSEVRRGLFMTVGGLPADTTRFARRIALNIQSVLFGTNAATLPVAFPVNKRYSFNMRTARAIGVLPRWAVLIDAERLFDDELGEGPTLSLAAALLEAIEANVELDVTRVDSELAAIDVEAARAALLPSFALSANSVKIDADRASPLGQAERQADLELSGRQLVYSERAHAAYRIAAHVASATDSEVRAAILDTAQAASRAYLGLLRALALEEVRKNNMEVTRANLELAKLRERIGASGRADVFRWENQIATDRKSLLSAQSERRRASVALSRVLSRPQDSMVNVDETSIRGPLSIVEDPRFNTFIGNPAVWETFQLFEVSEALERAPELKTIDALIDAQTRQLTAARRAYYVPDIALVTSAGRVVSESGAGSGTSAIPGLPSPDDDSWSIAVTASLPIFNGGALRTDVRRARRLLHQLELRRVASSQAIEARTRDALHRVGSSFPGIELSDAAARSADANLALVTDAYSAGAVSVTDLLDAQNASLSGSLGAAEARYAFLLDYADVLRAVGNFDLIVDPDSANAWYQRIESFFAAQGIEPLRR